jgi:hypothetical protein
MVAVALVVNDEICNNDAVGRPDSGSSDPVFRAADCRRVDDELVSVFVEGCSSLDTSDIGSVTKLGLGVRAKNLEPFSFRDPSLLLII